MRSDVGMAPLTSEEDLPPSAIIAVEHPAMPGKGEPQTDHRVLLL